jgi:UDP-glucose 6-dehydrogenase
MKVTVIGTGYVGLVTGACLAEVGKHLVCADVDSDKHNHDRLLVMEEARRIYGNQDTLTFANNPEDALKGADALVIVTERTVFRSPDWSELRELLKRPVIFDGRNMFEPARARDHGLEYYCVGRAL